MSDIEKPTETIKAFISNLLDKNAELKNKIDKLEAQIAGGVRVYAQREGVKHWDCSEAAVTKNARLLFDEQGSE